MPLYEYQCNDCDSRFDALVLNWQAGDDVVCRGCSGPNVHRLVSSFAHVGGLDDNVSVLRETKSSGGCCGGSCGCGH
jgi:putative FmdB family regulatory protein